VLVIGHRGASGHAPENTLAAFKKAAALGATSVNGFASLARCALRGHSRCHRESHPNGQAPCTI